MFMKKSVRFLLKSLFLFWLLLSALDLWQPGFAVYYIDLNILFFIILFLAVCNLFFLRSKEK